MAIQCGLQRRFTLLALCGMLHTSTCFRSSFRGASRPAIASKLSATKPDVAPQQLAKGIIDEIDIGKLLRETPLDGKPLTKLYQASKHGWSAVSFHAYVDIGMPSLVVGKTAKGTIFGGYNPCGWMSADDYRDTYNSFVFKTDKSGSPMICPKIGGSGAAVYDYMSDAVWFADALAVYMNPTKMGVRKAFSSLGFFYSALPDGTCSLFHGEGKAFKGHYTVDVTEIEVYCARGPKTDRNSNANANADTTASGASGASTERENQIADQISNLLHSWSGVETDQGRTNGGWDIAGDLGWSVRPPLRNKELYVKAAKSSTNTKKAAKVQAGKIGKAKALKGVSSASTRSTSSQKKQWWERL